MVFIKSSSSLDFREYSTSMRIQNKLIAIFFFTSALLVAAQVLIMQWSIGKGMIDYVNQRELTALDSAATSFSELFQKEGSWQSIQGKHRRFIRLIDDALLESEFGLAERNVGPRSEGRPLGPAPANRRPRGDEGPPRGGPPRGGPPRGEAGLPRFEADYALLNKEKELIAGMYPAELDFSYIDIMVESERVGFLAVSKRQKLTDGYELSFVKQQQRYIVFIALGLILTAMMVAIPLAWHFVDPIKRLAAAMSKLISGDYKQRIQLKRKDEFSQLSRDFNELAATLEQNEQARKRWLADVSHELRTPVAVLKGELEAMLDGVRPLSMERIQSSNDEVKQLEQLLDDLHELTRNDLGTMHYSKESLDIIALIKEEANHYQTFLGEQNIQVEFSRLPEQATLFADRKRIIQLFGNLFTNTAKYAREGDTLKISAEVVEDNDHKSLLVQLEDNGCGVNEHDLPQLFEHLFRVENSRNRETGGSGLGLSICKKIVQGHHGKIMAFSSDLGGLGIKIVLPME